MPLGGYRGVYSQSSSSCRHMPLTRKLCHNSIQCHTEDSWGYLSIHPCCENLQHP